MFAKSVARFLPFLGVMGLAVGTAHAGLVVTLSPQGSLGAPIEVPESTIGPNVSVTLSDNNMADKSGLSVTLTNLRMFVVQPGGDTSDVPTGAVLSGFSQPASLIISGFGSSTSSLTVFVPNYQTPQVGTLAIVMPDEIDYPPDKGPIVEVEFDAKYTIGTVTTTTSGFEIVQVYDTPEPSSAVLLGLSAITMIIFYSMRRRKRAGEGWGQTSARVGAKVKCAPETRPLGLLNRRCD
jgi:hypothetical protein